MEEATRSENHHHRHSEESWINMTPERLAELEALHSSWLAGRISCEEFDYTADGAFPALLGLAREALARLDGATAYQALCSRLWHEGYAVDLAYQGHYTARIVSGLTRRVYESTGRHETEVAAVQSAIEERERNNAD